jgi:hypothetical protein
MLPRQAAGRARGMGAEGSGAGVVARTAGKEVWRIHVKHRHMHQEGIASHNAAAVL